MATGITRCSGAPRLLTSKLRQPGSSTVLPAYLALIRHDAGHGRTRRGCRPNLLVFADPVHAHRQSRSLRKRYCLVLVSSLRPVLEAFPALLGAADPTGATRTTRILGLAQTRTRPATSNTTPTAKATLETSRIRRSVGRARPSFGVLAIARMIRNLEAQSFIATTDLGQIIHDPKMMTNATPRPIMLPGPECLDPEAIWTLNISATHPR